MECPVVLGLVGREGQAFSPSAISGEQGRAATVLETQVLYLLGLAGITTELCLRVPSDTFRLPAPCTVQQAVKILCERAVLHISSRPWEFTHLPYPMLLQDRSEMSGYDWYYFRDAQGKAEGEMQPEMNWQGYWSDTR